MRLWDYYCMFSFLTCKLPKSSIIKSDSASLKPEDGNIKYEGFRLILRSRTFRVCMMWDRPVQIRRQHSDTHTNTSSTYMQSNIHSLNGERYQCFFKASQAFPTQQNPSPHVSTPRQRHPHDLVCSLNPSHRLTSQNLPPWSHQNLQHAFSLNLNLHSLSNLTISDLRTSHKKYWYR